jgi:serine protease Do
MNDDYPNFQNMGEGKSDSIKSSANTQFNNNQSTQSSQTTGQSFVNTPRNFENLEKADMQKSKKLKTGGNNFLSSFGFIIFTFIISFSSGVLAVLVIFNSPLLVKKLNLGNFGNRIKNQETINQINNLKTVNEESAVIDVASKTTDSVVSIIITKDLPVIGSRFRDFFGNPIQDDRRGFGQTERRQVGAGSGFIVSKDGFILTNRHVVEDPNADYTVVFNNGDTLSAKVLARDPLMDVAVIKVQADKEFKPIQLGDSTNLKIGQIAIAIGNSLGEFNNTFSKGIISGLGRTILASDRNGNGRELLENIIQTDASINPGNSGGPLVDIEGNVIGMNVANSPSGENIGFAIPISEIKPILQSVIETGKIQRPYLGISFLPITPEFAKLNNLPVDYGALLNAGDGVSAVAVGGPASKAGLRQGDIILEIDGQRIDQNNTLPKQVQAKNVGDEVVLKVLRGDAQIEVKLTLEARPSE